MASVVSATLRRSARRWILRGIGTGACILVLLALCAHGVPVAANPRLNVLFIVADDLNGDLGCYDHPLVQTPNLDRLAKRGVRFDRAYCQYPLCNPSRSSVLTGLRPNSLHVYNNGPHFREFATNVVTLPQLFRKNGYYSARVGKIFHAGVPMEIGMDGKDDPPSWDLALNPRGRDKEEESLLVNFTPKRSLGSCLCYQIADGSSEEQTDGKVASEAIKLLETNRGQSFFLGVGFYRPHSPHIAPKKFFDLYPLEKIAAPPNSYGSPDSLPRDSLFIKPPNWGATLQQQREVIRAYYACVSFLDEQVGRVLDALDRLKLADRTIVVFWSDHGYLLGEHGGQWMKTMLFEAATRVPLIIAGPGIAKGKACPRTVELVDLYPTVADLCGLQAPACLQGVSLRRLLQQPEAKWDIPAYTQVLRLDTKGRPPGYSVRTERWRYTEWEQGNGGVELYDYDKDPSEFTNLANKVQYTNVLSEMRSLLRKLPR